MIPAGDALFNKATWISLGCALVLSAVWLWCCWCSFPGIPWNDTRVAPAVALHKGISIYSLANSGPVSTWIYGPLPLLVMWPAGLASNATRAIEVAGAMALASLWLKISRLPVLPNVQAYREGTYLAARMPEKIWFPLHPLVTLYSDGRFYHDLDGLCERTFAGQRPTDPHFFAHVPRQRRVSATLLPVGWGLADIAEGRLPPDNPVRTFGLWRLDGVPE